MVKLFKKGLKFEFKFKIKNPLVLSFGVIGVSLFIVSVLFLSNTYFFQSLLVISLLLGGLPFVITQYVTYRRAKEIEVNLPDFLRDVAESNRSGMPLVRAIETASKGSYGALSVEMKLISSQISWGVPFEDTMEKFAARIKSKLVRQAVTIIVESHRSGGNIADILETVSTDIKTLKRIEIERKSKLKIYLISIYMIFLLFLGIIITLTITFVPATPDLNKAAGLLGGTPSSLSEDDFKNFFFHLSLIQAFFAGLIGGQMGEGNVLSGVKHAFALIIITIVSFQIFLAPPLFSDRLASVIVKIPLGSVNVESSPSQFTIFQSVTSSDIATKVIDIAQGKKISGFEDLKADKIVFSATECAPCLRGDIVVDTYSVVVNKPTKIIYNVVALGGAYRVIIGGT